MRHRRLVRRDLALLPPKAEWMTFANLTPSRLTSFSQYFIPHSILSQESHPAEQSNRCLLHSVIWRKDKLEITTKGHVCLLPSVKLSTPTTYVLIINHDLKGFVEAASSCARYDPPPLPEANSTAEILYK